MRQGWGEGWGEGSGGGLLTYGVVDQEPGDHYGKKRLERSDRVKMREDRGLKNNKAVALVSDAAAGVSKFWGSGFVISHTI